MMREHKFMHLMGLLSFWWRVFLLGGDVDGVGLVKAFFEIADGQAEPFADLGDFPSAENEKNDGQYDDQFEKA